MVRLRSTQSRQWSGILSMVFTSLSTPLSLLVEIHHSLPHSQGNQLSFGRTNHSIPHNRADGCVFIHRVNISTSGHRLTPKVTVVSKFVDPLLKGYGMQSVDGTSEQFRLKFCISSLVDDSDTKTVEEQAVDVPSIKPSLGLRSSSFQKVFDLVSTEMSPMAKGKKDSTRWMRARTIVPANYTYSDFDEDGKFGVLESPPSRDVDEPRTPGGSPDIKPANSSITPEKSAGIANLWKKSEGIPFTISLRNGGWLLWQGTFRLEKVGK